MDSELSLKLYTLRRLLKEKKIDETTYTDSVMKVIGVKQQ